MKLPPLVGERPNETPCPLLGEGRGGGFLALSALSSDLRHMTPVAADRLATLSPRLTGFGRGEFVRRALLVGRPSALGGDGPLTLIAHTGEAATATRPAP